MISVSTRFLGQPKLTKCTFIFFRQARGLRLFVLNEIRESGIANQEAITNNDFRITNNRPKIKEQGNVAALRFIYGWKLFNLSASSTQR
jgi:hypothetical protein